MRFPNDNCTKRSGRRKRVSPVFDAHKLVFVICSGRSFHYSGTELLTEGDVIFLFYMYLLLHLLKWPRSALMCSFVPPVTISNEKS